MRRPERWTCGIGVLLVCATFAASAARARQIGIGPTRIKIAAGTLTDADTRAGLVGTWQPDMDLASRGLPPDANTITYLANGLYMNPFQGRVVMVGVWAATARSLSMMPLEIRRIDTGEAVPDAKELFAQIRWGQTSSRPLTWLAPDRFQDSADGPPMRRLNPPFDLRAVTGAATMDLLAGSWQDARGVQVTFGPSGRFREELRGTVLVPGPPAASVLGLSVTGSHVYDPATGLLTLTVDAVNTTGQNVPFGVREQVLTAGRKDGILSIGARPPASVEWAGANEVVIDGRRWQRRPAP